MLNAAQTQLVADRIAQRRYRRGDRLVERGRCTHGLFVILSGRARVLVADGKGREVTFATMRPGDYVGEMSLLDNEPHSATVQIETASEVLVLGRDEFMRCLRESTHMSYAILRDLVHRLRGANRQIESLALLDVYGRVARSLMELSEIDGDMRVIRSRVSRSELAKVVGASREMVSRVMKDLEVRALIHTRDNGSIVIIEVLA